jgi:quercetin dioxygenase-like cupin family protein
MVAPMTDPTHYGPGEGERIDAGAGSALVLKATGETTGGSFFMSESTIAPGFSGPPPHTHHRLHDMFYVLEGVLTMRLGDETHDVPAGSFVCVPPGIVHTFSNQSDSPVRFLNMNTPSGFEHYMRDLGAAAKAGPLTPEVMGPIASRYDFERA